MRIKNTMPLIGLILAVSGCASVSDSGMSKSYFNKADFSGLASLNDANSIKLDDEITLLHGKNKHISSCYQIDHINEDEVLDSQYNRYKLFEINCYAAKQYLSGKQASKSFFIGKSLLNIVSDMPANVVPDLGGNTLSLGKGKTLSVFNYPLKVISNSKRSVKVILKNGVNVNYILMARQDINGDGIEDIILRMDWNIPDSFGAGSSMIALTKNSKTSSIKELWRK